LKTHVVTLVVILRPCKGSGVSYQNVVALVVSVGSSGDVAALCVDVVALGMMHWLCGDPFGGVVALVVTW
jgi:type IV pilus biogenesis protein CpaD/CtpE